MMAVFLDRPGKGRDISLKRETFHLIIGTGEGMWFIVIYIDTPQGCVTCRIVFEQPVISTPDKLKTSQGSRSMDWRRFVYFHHRNVCSRKNKRKTPTISYRILKSACGVRRCVPPTLETTSPTPSKVAEPHDGQLFSLESSLSIPGVGPIIGRQVPEEQTTHERPHIPVEESLTGLLCQLVSRNSLQGEATCT